MIQISLNENEMVEILRRAYERCAQTADNLGDDRVAHAIRKCAAKIKILGFTGQTLSYDLPSAYLGAEEPAKEPDFK